MPSAPKATYYFLHAPAELPPPELKLPTPVAAQLQGFDLVYDAFSSAWKGRVASLHPKPGASVYGLLYALTAEQLSKVERWRSGEEKIEVDVQAPKKMKAIAFATPEGRRTREGDISETFLTALVTGAEQAELPAEYVEKLKAEAEIVQRVQRFGAAKRTA